jgi:hypothetical protein
MSKVVVVFLVLILGIQSAVCADGVAHFKYARCYPSSEFVHPNTSCFAKAYNRNLTTVNVAVWFTKPLDDLFVSFFILKVSLRKFPSFFSFKIEIAMQYKYGTIYRQVLQLPRFNACDLFSVTSKQNILAYQIVLLAKVSCPGAIHRCPYSVGHEANL